MFEAERVLLTEMPFVPLFTYVTKRMVNPRLKGWQSNVMDHHYSKDMFFLKAQTDEMADTEPEELETTAPGEEQAGTEETAEETAVPEDGSGTVTTEKDAGMDAPAEPEETPPPENDAETTPEGEIQ